MIEALFGLTQSCEILIDGSLNPVLGFTLAIRDPGFGVFHFRLSTYLTAVHVIRLHTSHDGGSLINGKPVVRRTSKTRFGTKN